MRSVAISLIMAAAGLIAYWNKPADLFRSLLAQSLAGTAAAMSVRPASVDPPKRLARFLIGFGLSGLAFSARDIVSGHPHGFDAVALVSSIAFILGVAWFISESALAGHTATARIKVAVRESAVLRLAQSELRLLRYAIFPPARDAGEAAGTAEFWMARDASQLAWAFVVVAVMESLALHLLVAGLGKVWLWIVVVLADVTILYAVGIVRSLSRIPVTLDANGSIHVRVGLLFDCRINVANVAAVGTPHLPKTKSTLNGALLSAPNIQMRLHAPVAVSILGLFQKNVTDIRLKLATPDAFIVALGDCRRD